MGKVPVFHTTGPKEKIPPTVTMEGSKGKRFWGIYHVPGTVFLRVSIFLLFLISTVLQSRSDNSRFYSSTSERLKAIKRQNQHLNLTPCGSRGSELGQRGLGWGEEEGG